MTTTWTLSLPTTEELDLKLYNVAFADRGNFALISDTTVVSGVSTVHTATFEYNSSDTVAVRMGVVMRREYNSRLNRTFCSLKVSVFEREYNDATYEITDRPMDVGISWSTEGDLPPSIANVLKLIETSTMLLAPALTGTNEHPTSTTISQYARSILDL
jgi:hypothetical protein